MNGLSLSELLRMRFRSSFSFVDQFFSVDRFDKCGSFAKLLKKKARQKMPLVHLEREQCAGWISTGDGHAEH